jgi:hypothetical protein
MIMADGRQIFCGIKDQARACKFINHPGLQTVFKFIDILGVKHGLHQID